MARPLSELTGAEAESGDLGRDLGLSHRTGRAFAAALAVLLLATIVVDRSSDALLGDSASAASVVASGTVDLSDDDQGRSLFRLDALTPARPATRCIQVTYDGSILPVDLRVRADAAGPLSRFLDVSIEQGTGGRFGECDGFTPDSTVYRGALDDLAAADWVPVDSILNRGETRSFRVTIDLEDTGDALGLDTNLSFAWEVVPS